MTCPLSAGFVRLRQISANHSSQGIGTHRGMETHQRRFAGEEDCANGGEGS